VGWYVSRWDVRVYFLLYAVWADAVAVEPPVYFRDIRLEQAVENALGVMDPTPADMLGLLSLQAANLGIEDLAGIEYAKGLQVLDLSRNRIRELSALSDLTQLRSLDLSNNLITDLTPLHGLVMLQDLNLHMNRISDISPLASLVMLEHLDLHENQVKDISPLLGLRSLKSLVLLFNPLNEQACDSIIPELIASNPELWVSHHPCKRPSITISSTAGGDVILPGEGVFFLSQYGELIQLTVQADPGFYFSHWSGTFSSTANPAWLWVDRDHCIRAIFVSAEPVLFVQAGADNGKMQDGTSGYPFSNIQDAVDVAADGATIIVRPGLYRQHVDLSGKRVRLTGIASQPEEELAFPVIDGNGCGPVFNVADHADCGICGLVITGGRGTVAAAIKCSTSHLQLSNCLVVGNRATDVDGSAIECLNSTMEMVNCTIADNIGHSVSATSSDVLIRNSIIWGNTGQDLRICGGTCLVEYSDTSCLQQGPGNMAVDPLFGKRGYWAWPNDQVHADADPDWVSGDYHLRSGAGRWDPVLAAWIQNDQNSPCIDAGDPTSDVGSEPMPNGGRVNMGAYGGTTQASKSSDNG